MAIKKKDNIKLLKLIDKDFRKHLISYIEYLIESSYEEEYNSWDLCEYVLSESKETVKEELIDYIKNKYNQKIENFIKNYKIG